jgi:hypothetical protein
MAQFQILYWQDIPSQVKAWDDFDEVKVELAPRFTERIDRAAMQKGLTGTDAFLEQWRWGDEQERNGTAQEVADAVRRELESGAP